MAGAQIRLSTPEEQGVDSVALGDGIEMIAQKRIPIHSMLIVRHDAVVLDAYFYPYEPRVPHDIASVTKSVTSMLTGIAIDMGYIKSAKEPALPLLKIALPPANDPRKGRITVESLLSMTSGLACGELHEAHTAETNLDNMRQSPDWIQYAVSIPMRAEPGEQFAYCSVNNHILPAIITAQTGQRLETFARQNLFEPLGIKEWIWPADSNGLNHGWGDLHLFPRDMAKLGYLYLHEGKLGDRQIVSKDWVRKSIEPHAQVRDGVGYGYSWWINLGREPHIPEAEGRGGQRISIVPDKDTVVVFTSGGADTDQVAPYILRALRSDKPLAANPAGANRLAQLLKSAQLPPKPSTSSKLPSAAARISGKRYSFDANALEMHSLSLVFDRSEEARMTVEIGAEEWRGPIGLDGVYRFSPIGHRGQPMAVSGKWQGENEFLLDVNLVSNITRILLTIRFAGDRAELDVTDTTGSFHGLKLSGLARD